MADADEFLSLLLSLIVLANDGVLDMDADDVSPDEEVIVLFSVVVLVTDAFLFLSLPPSLLASLDDESFDGDSFVPSPLFDLDLESLE